MLPQFEPTCKEGLPAPREMSQTQVRQSAYVAFFLFSNTLRTSKPYGHKIWMSSFQTWVVNKKLSILF